MGSVRAHLLVAQVPVLHGARVWCPHPVLTAYPGDDQAALLTVVTAFRRFDWDRFMLGWATAFHLVAAILMAVWPYEQLANDVTRPILALADRQVWTLLFLAAFMALTALYASPSRLYGLIVLILVLFLGGVWLTALGLAVLHGEGSPMFVLVWFFLYVPWLLAIGKSEGR